MNFTDSNDWGLGNWEIGIWIGIGIGLDWIGIWNWLWNWWLLRNGLDFMTSLWPRRGRRFVAPSMRVCFIAPEGQSLWRIPVCKIEISGQPGVQHPTGLLLFSWLQSAGPSGARGGCRAPCSGQSRMRMNFSDCNTLLSGENELHGQQ